MNTKRKLVERVDEVVVVKDHEGNGKKLILLSRDKSKVAQISGRSSFVTSGSLEHIGDIIKRYY